MSVTEAVIISGPRRGEFITLPDAIGAAPSDETVDALNAALRELDAFLVSAIEETRSWRRALRRAEPCSQIPAPCSLLPAPIRPAPNADCQLLTAN